MVFRLKLADGRALYSERVVKAMPAGGRHDQPLSRVERRNFPVGGSCNFQFAPHDER